MLALPHIYLVEYWGFVAIVVAIVNWFIALVRGRTPLAVHEWLARYARYSTHVTAYVCLLADPYPKFRGWPGTYPVDLRVDPPVAQSRWKIGFRLPLAIRRSSSPTSWPSFSLVVAILSWFVALAVARVPRGSRTSGLLRALPGADSRRTCCCSPTATRGLRAGAASSSKGATS